MKVINQYIIFVYIFLISAIIVLFFDLLYHLIRLMKTTVKDTADKINVVADDVQRMNDTTDRIAKTGESWTFFLSVYAVYLIVRETIKYYRSERSLSRSFAKAAIRHSGQLGKIRI